MPLLLCGFAVQVLDEDDPPNGVSLSAMERLPNVLKTAVQRQPAAATDALPSSLDALFKIYDDPKCRKLHKAAHDAIECIVNDFVAENDPDGVNKLVSTLGQKVSVEAIRTPKVRQFAMRQLQRSMFPADNALIEKVFADGLKMEKLPAVSESDLAPKGSAERDWFAVAVGDKEAPSSGSRVNGDKHRDDVAAAISEMICDPNPENKRIGLNLADLFNERNGAFKRRLDGHALPIYQKWKFGPLRPYDMKLPPKGPLPKSKVQPINPADYVIKQQQDINIATPSLPDL